MKVIASYNLKGGVGKTATAVNLAYLAAQEGSRVLICDLDPQGATSYYYRTDADRQREGQAPDFPVQATAFENLDQLPVDITNEMMEMFLEDNESPGNRLRDLFDSFEDKYDYIVLDCPPGISVVSESIFSAADALVIPTIPTTLSLRTLKRVVRMWEERDQSKTRLLPFFSLADLRKNMHRGVITARPNVGIDYLHATIPYATEVERMGTERRPVNTFADYTKAGRAYRNLWQEVKEAVNQAQEEPTTDENFGGPFYDAFRAAGYVA